MCKCNAIELTFFSGFCGDAMKTNYYSLLKKFHNTYPTQKTMGFVVSQQHCYICCVKTLKALRVYPFNSSTIRKNNPVVDKKIQTSNKKGTFNRGSKQV